MSDSSPIPQALRSGARALSSEADAPARAGVPAAQGLYDPAHEHDACGVGFVAHIKGRKSHAIVEQGLLILKNLTHRGAVGADPKASDGAGVLIQLPDAFFQESAERRVRVGLVLAEIIRTRQLQPDDEKVRAMIRRLASAYNDPESVARYYYSNEEQLAQVEQAVLEEQVVELVVSESGVTEVAASYDELIAPRPNPGAVS